MVRDISETAHCDFSAQVDLHLGTAYLTDQGRLALMITTTGRLAAKSKTKGVRSDSVRRGKCRQVDTASIDKNARSLAHLWGRRMATSVRSNTDPMIRISFVSIFVEPGTPTFAAPRRSQFTHHLLARATGSRLNVRQRTNSAGLHPSWRPSLNCDRAVVTARRSHPTRSSRSASDRRSAPCGRSRHWARQAHAKSASPGGRPAR